MPPILHSRRRALILLPTTLAAATLAPRASASQPAATAQPSAYDPNDHLPSQPPALVQEIVGASHANLERVQALLKDMPQLANAAIDWGFGDWETALGAASHTGRRAIAELLIAHGARPDIFTFAMMGKLDAVKAMVAAQPGIQRIRGPHGITLLSHAKAGGDDAKAVAEYLASLGDADIAETNEPLTADLKSAVIGAYSFGPRDTDRLEVAEKNEKLWINRTNRPQRRLTYLGNFTFHPAGAPDVRIVFDPSTNGAKSIKMTITAPAPVVIAQRV